MRKIWLLCLLGLIGFGPAEWTLPAQAEMARYDVDPEHSMIEFRVAHMVISKTTGHFKDYSGFIEMDPEGGVVKTIDATIKTSSVNTNHEKRDAHLRNPDFFDVEKHPVMTYKMKEYKKTGDHYTAVGDLTLHGVTKPITLVGNFTGVTKDPWGNIRAGFYAEGSLNRKDFGMVWNKALDSGAWSWGTKCNSSWMLSASRPSRAGFMLLAVIQSMTD